MVIRTAHGGDYSCCGVSHLSRFGATPTDEEIARMDQLIQQKLDNLYARNQHRPGEPENKTNHLFDICMTDDQLRVGWDRTLKQKGFRLVSRFFNSNSGNFVNVLHYSPTRATRRIEELPFDWSPVARA